MNVSLLFKIFKYKRKLPQLSSTCINLDIPSQMISLALTLCDCNDPHLESHLGSCSGSKLHEAWRFCDYQDHPHNDNPNTGLISMTPSQFPKLKKDFR